jgi:isocitrate lyase
MLAYSTSRPKHRLFDQRTGGWYPIDFARGRPGNPARIPVSPLGRWYNCSPSFNWKKKLPAGKIAAFQREIGKMGYRFQFVTLAGFHSLNLSMFNLARGYKERGMAAYGEMRQAEFAAEPEGYTATRHQREVGAGYFDAAAMAISGGKSSTTVFAGSTEADQFHDHGAVQAHERHDDGLVHNHEWAVTAK